MPGFLDGRYNLFRCYGFCTFECPGGIFVVRAPVPIVGIESVAIETPPAYRFIRRNPYAVFHFRVRV